MAAALDSETPGQILRLDDGTKAAVLELVQDWEQGKKVERLWGLDPTLWTGKDEGRWLGWLDVVKTQLASVHRLQALTQTVQRGGFTHAVLLGMGGSSLAAEVLSRVLPGASGCPTLHVLDSTDPAQIRAVSAGIDEDRTLFIVSSKSGTTLETRLLAEYFTDRIRTRKGERSMARQFAYIGDPGSSLEQQAAERGAFAFFAGDPSIGGRYSALSDFGLVPAAIMGIDCRRLLESAASMHEASRPGRPILQNPAVLLGLVLGTLARRGRDKLTVLASPTLTPLGPWLEQLLAESTGKNGMAILPIEGEAIGPADVYDEDRAFVHLVAIHERDERQEAAVRTLNEHGHPVLRVEVPGPHHVGGEFFRWEIATAVAGAVLGIHPFDQPDVESAKQAARSFMEEYDRSGTMPAETPMVSTDGVEMYVDGPQPDVAAVGDGKSLLRSHLDRLQPSGYFAVLAYLPRDRAREQQLQELRMAVRDRRRVATSVGFGPRYLHSTGQAHKGGPDGGVFLVITCEHEVDAAIPSRAHGFSVVELAQARADMKVLGEKGRPVLRIHLRAPWQARLEQIVQWARAIA